MFTGSQTLSVLPYNCNSDSVHKRGYIESLIDHYKSEYVCLQKPWLQSRDAKPKLSKLAKNCIPYGVSGNNEKELLQQGGPKAGVPSCGTIFLLHTVTELLCNNK